ncbi:hypothetical protein LTR86_011019 [Recurvomyces mirabilis]|nr:hypothetical protein LTR86_011019 [Recurvomyces mirabilis]
MPSSPRFSLTDVDASEHPKEGLLDDSDFEELYDNQADRKSPPSHYWFGKRLFKQMLAEKIVRDTTASDTSDGLDAMLVESVAQYPYGDRTRQVSSLSSAQTVYTDSGENTGDFRAFVTELAAVFLRSDAQVRIRVTSMVQDGMGSLRQPLPSRPATQSRSTSAARIQQVMNRMLQNNDDGLLERPRYTTALKEYGDQNRVDVRWTDMQVSVSPLCWQVAAMVDSATFRATAGNKREAKHRASQIACEALGIAL